MKNKVYKILYPRGHEQPIKVVARISKKDRENFAFADDGFKDLRDVEEWLNWRNITYDRRPKIVQ